MNKNTLVVLAVIAAAGIGYYLWQKKQKEKVAPTVPNSSTGNAPTSKGGIGGALSDAANIYNSASDLYDAALGQA